MLDNEKSINDIDDLKAKYKELNINIRNTIYNE
jgi:hypothetical protein